MDGDRGGDDDNYNGDKGNNDYHSNRDKSYWQMRVDNIINNFL